MSDETKQQQRKPSVWRPILPVPEGTPAPKFTHTQRGEPRRIFIYRDVEGRVLGYVCQFMRSAGGVAQLTRTWCRNEGDNTFAWQWKQFEKLRPLYGAEYLDPQTEGRKIVLIVADEYVAEELRPKLDPDGSGRLMVPDHPFIGYDLVSWPGGRSKIGEVDFSPLRGRICTIWMPHSAERFKVGKSDPGSGTLLPIEKQPWRVTARNLRETIVAFGAVPFSIIEAGTIEELPDGWDPVRAMDMGWDLRRLYDWMSARLGSAAEFAEANKLAATPTKASSGGHWMETLIRKDGTGPLLPEIHNVRKILTNHDRWRDVIWLDEFAQKVMKAKPPPFEGGAAGEWSDFDDSMTADWLSSECGILKLRSPLVAEGVHAVARLHARNPVHEYLQECKRKWVKDGRKDRLSTWLHVYLGAGMAEPDDGAGDMEHREKYLRLVGRMWMRGAAARALKPGIKFDLVLILEGHQGLGKSSALAILGGDFAMDTPFSLSDKEGWETMQGAWIIEIAELDAMNKADVKTSKTFFSRTKDRFRLPWARRSAEFKRACVFAGTTNEHEYFRDRTGNRRYLPVHCRRDFDRDALERDRDLLFGEAVASFEAGERLFFDKEEIKLVRIEQLRRMRQDPWFGRIARWLIDPQREKEVDPSSGKQHPVTITRIIQSALGAEISRADEHGWSTRIGHALQELGWERKENKALPERYHYVKRQSSEEGDE